MNTIEKIKRDRYTHLLIAIILITIISLVAIKIKNQKLFALTLLGGGGFLILKGFLSFKKTRLHITDSEIQKFKPLYKGESSQGFKPYVKVDTLDGIKIKGIRYKLVNGTDFYLDSTGTPQPMGPGSAIMNKLFGGGAEPESIQEKQSWK